MKTNHGMLSVPARGRRPGAGGCRILLGVCARLLALVQGGLTLLRRWKPAAPTGGETGPAS